MISPDDLVTDYMGLPLRRVELVTLLDRIHRQMSLPAGEVAEYANRVIKDRHPSFEGQVSFTPEDF